MTPFLVGFLAVFLFLGLVAIFVLRNALLQIAQARVGSVVRQE